VRAGWLIDGSGGPVRKNVLIRIEAGRFASLVTEHRDGLTHGDRSIIDLRGHTLLPPLVNCHVHLTMSGTLDPLTRDMQLQNDFHTAAEIIRGHLRSHLAHGVTAVRDGGDSMGHTLTFASEYKAATRPPIAIHAAGRAWRAPGRYGRLIGRPPKAGQSLADAVGKCAEPCDQIKLVNSGLNSLTQYGHETAPQFGLDELRTAVAAAHRRGLRVMVHANGRLPVGMCLDAACDSIEHGFFMGEANLVKMARKRIAWVPTAVTMQAYRDKMGQEEKPDGHKALQPSIAAMNLEHQMEQMQRARALGVRMAVGSDAGSPGVEHGEGIIAEMELMLEAGFSLPETVKAASRTGAILLNLDDRGIIAVNKRADFIAVKGQPLGLPKSLKNIAWLFIKGQAYKPGEANRGDEQKTKAGCLRDTAAVALRRGF
jgi:imidazolonepropionase-like amidohydrolase